MDPGDSRGLSSSESGWPHCNVARNYPTQLATEVMPSIDVCRLRLANQHLVGQTLDKAADVVQLLGAVQAQDYSSAKWALAQRTRGASDSQIEKEIDDGEILRTHVLRPTWHFVGPTDIRWMLALTGPRVKALL